jgi:hypothetical protein
VSGIVHPATRVVVLAVATAARDGSWVCTRDMAAAMGADRTVARRTCRELAIQDWLYRRETAPDPARQQAGAGGEWWRVGPRVLDMADRYRSLLDHESRVLSELELAAGAPLSTGVELRGVNHDPDTAADGSRIGHAGAAHHQATAIVLGLVEALFGFGTWASVGRVARFTNVHRQTTSDVLDELTRYAWAERRDFEGLAIYRIGPGVARLAARPVPRLAPAARFAGRPVSPGGHP